jgi:hypothetical protein
MCNYIQSEGGSQTGQPWRGTQTITCDLCKVKDPTCFVDGKLEGSTTFAIMCIPCFKAEGAGTGQGRGQKYCKKQ